MNMRDLLWIFCGGALFLHSIVVGAQAPFRFIENKNQWPADVDFVARIPGGRMVLSEASFRYYLLDEETLDALHHRSHDPDAASGSHEYIRGHAVFVEFPEADCNAVPRGLGRSGDYRNYYLGDDPSRWASRAFAYAGVMYESFFPGVDLMVYAQGQHLKYDFVVASGGDPSVITAVYRGTEKLFLDQGDLVIRTSLGDIIEKKPVAWQIINGERVQVPCSFFVDGNTVSFLFPEGYDGCYELIIDPLLIFSTYSGSTADNWGSTATPGERGTLYSAGVTNEQAGGTFPATPGAYQLNSGGLYDIGILKYDSLGTGLLYATYLGGNSNDSPHSLVVNSEDELLLMGTTGSSDYPTTADAFDRSFNGGLPVDNVIGYPYSEGCDIVISRFAPDGTALLSSTFVGGTGNDGLNPPGGALTRNYGDQLRGDIITDAEGNVYVSSVTGSLDFPVVSSFGMAYGGGATDALLFRMNAELSTLEWATFIGGAGTDAAHSLKLDREGNVFAAGGTSSADFPTTAGSYQPIYRGNADGWIAKLAPDGSSILHATLTGTDGYNQIYFVDLNDAGEVYVYGQTTGQFPVTPGVYHNPNSGQFIQKFSHTLDALIFSTVFGAGRGIPDISPTAFLVSECNNLYVAGWGGRINAELNYWNSGTSGMTTTPDAFQSTTSGSDFYFLVLTDDARERLYATFFGGSQSVTHVDGGTSRFDKNGIVYHSVCAGCSAYNLAGRATSDFPSTPGAWSEVNRSINCNNAAFKFDLSTLKARIRTNSEKRDAPGLKVVCLPEPLGFENLSTGGQTFHWDFGDGETAVRTDTAFVTHAYKTPGTYVVTLIAVDQGTCQVMDKTSTVVVVNEAQSFIQDDADMCAGDRYTLQSSGGLQYAWRSADGSFISHDPTPVVSPADTMTYYITLTEPNGCIQKDTVRINVIPAIAPEFEWEKVADCTGRPGLWVRNKTDSLKAGDAWFFDFGDGVKSDLEEDTHRFGTDGVYPVTLVTQREFCVYEKSVAVPVFEMFIPNVITPDGSGQNDVFTIRYGEIEGVTPADYGYRVSLTVFNRWGEQVFHADDYQYDWSGEGLAAGTYYYEVSVEEHTLCKSWLQIMR